LKFMLEFHPNRAHPSSLWGAAISITWRASDGPLPPGQPSISTKSRRVSEITQRLPPVALADIDEIGEPRFGEIAAGICDLLGYQLGTDDSAAPPLSRIAATK